MPTISSNMLDNVKRDAKTAHDAIERAKTALADIKKMDGTTKNEAAVKTAATDDEARKKEIEKLKPSFSDEEKDYKPVRDKVTKLMNEAVKLDKAVAAELVEAKKLGLLPRGLIHVDAVAEIGTDAKIIADVKKVFEKTAGGRSAPGTSGVNHIHVSGNAQENLLFDTGNQMVLGIVQGHMDKEAKPSVLQAAAKVAGRKGGSSKKMRIVDGKLVEIK